MIYTPKIYGTCMGSARAIKLASDAVSDNTYMFKEILHNKDVISSLKNKGIKFVTDIKDIPDGSTVIIRAHGEGQDVYKYFEEHNIKIVDTTCTKVIKIHEIVKSKSEDGYTVIIVGKKGHAEAEGTLGWTKNGILVEKVEDLDSIKNVKDNILVIAQTTINEVLFNDVCKKVKSTYKDKNIEIVNSICNAQECIQSSSIEVAKKVKYIFVLGGENSSNTKELLNKCNKHTKGFLVSNKTGFLKLLSTITVNKKIDVGFTAGASTPKEKVKEYIDIYNFYISYKDFKARIEKKMDKFNKTFTSKEDNKYVRDAIDKFTYLNSDGKYIRSFLINLAYSLKNKDTSYSDYLSLAYETFETAILVHDDIIDCASTRRGKMTIPINYKKELEIKESTKLGNDIAICLGDYAFYKASLLLAEKYRSDKNYPKLVSFYDKVVLSTIKGEILDVYLPFKDQYLKIDSDINNIIEIYRLKTSWYTIVGPFVMGLILSGASESKIKDFIKVLEPLGIAFQIKDDIIGVFNDQNVLGKDSDDISEYKETILYYYALNSSYKDSLLKYYGKKLNKEELDKVKNIFIESKALEKSELMMDNLFNESRNYLDKMNVSKEFKSILYGFMDYLKLREK